MFEIKDSVTFNLRMGLPEMEAVWRDLSDRKRRGLLDKDEEKFFKKRVQSLGYLAENPRHNSLAAHEIDDVSRKYETNTKPRRPRKWTPKTKPK